VEKMHLLYDRSHRYGFYIHGIPPVYFSIWSPSRPLRPSGVMVGLLKASPLGLLA